MSDLNVPPHLFIVLGATGDLTSRKLLPALYHLNLREALYDRWQLLGVARTTSLDNKSFRARAREALAAAGLLVGDTRRWCDECVHYQPIGLGTLEDYKALADRIEVLEKAHHLPGNRVFYLALPPEAFPDTIEKLGMVGLNRSPGWTRIVIEKPFGRDLASARVLNQLVHRYFDEPQIYRIDHYLGKHSVQNLLVFRFANPIFESVWNRDRVERVEITVAEDLGVEGRAGYYEQAGALRDMVQNHLTQLMTLIAMEIPTPFEADAIHYEKLKVLRQVTPIGLEDVVFGQYTQGQIDGREVPGYREEKGIAPDSDTETFVALRLHIENWRWQGVPFYFRTGKRLPRRLTQIVVTFRCPPVSLFQPLGEACDIHSNLLLITLQPNEGFDLCFEVKAPGDSIDLQTQSLQFRYTDAFGPLPDAYETLLLDVVKGDQTLFVRADVAEASWRLYTPLLEQRPPVYPYAAGTWGPPEATRLLTEKGKSWTSL